MSSPTKSTNSIPTREQRIHEIQAWLESQTAQPLPAPTKVPPTRENVSKLDQKLSHLLNYELELRANTILDHLEQPDLHEVLESLTVLENILGPEPSRDDLMLKPFLNAQAGRLVKICTDQFHLIFWLYWSPELGNHDFESTQTESNAAILNRFVLSNTTVLERFLKQNSSYCPIDFSKDSNQKLLAELIESLLPFVEHPDAQKLPFSIVPIEGLLLSVLELEQKQKSPSETSFSSSYDETRVWILLLKLIRKNLTQLLSNESTESVDLCNRSIERLVPLFEKFRDRIVDLLNLDLFNDWKIKFDVLVFEVYKFFELYSKDYQKIQTFTSKSSIDHAFDLIKSSILALFAQQGSCSWRHFTQVNQELDAQQLNYPMKVALFRYLAAHRFNRKVHTNCRASAKDGSESCSAAEEESVVSKESTSFGCLAPKESTASCSSLDSCWEIVEKEVSKKVNPVPENPEPLNSESNNPEPGTSKEEEDQEESSSSLEEKKKQLPNPGPVQTKEQLLEMVQQTHAELLKSQEMIAELLKSMADKDLI